jgi:hypothetical protein
MGQVGFAMLLCAFVAIKWTEELLWRITHVRWVVTESTHPHHRGMVASKGPPEKEGWLARCMKYCTLRP